MKNFCKLRINLDRIIALSHFGNGRCKLSDWHCQIKRCCQTNENPSQFAAKPVSLCGTKPTPLRESSGAAELEIVSRIVMALLIEMILDRGVDGDEFL